MLGTSSPLRASNRRSVICDGHAEDASIDSSERRVRFEQQALPHLDAAYNLARWLTRSDTEADDVVQDALLLALRGIESLRGDNAKAWLLAIVRNCYLTHLRKHLPHARVTDSLDDAQVAAPMLFSDDDPEAALVAEHRARSFDEALRALPRAYREVVILRELEDLPYREIAEVIGVPIGTVMSRLARARSALKSHWLRTVEGERA